MDALYDVMSSFIELFTLMTSLGGPMRTTVARIMCDQQLYARLHEQHPMGVSEVDRSVDSLPTIADVATPQTDEKFGGRDELRAIRFQLRRSSKWSRSSRPGPPTCAYWMSSSCGWCA